MPKKAAQNQNPLAGQKDLFPVAVTPDDTNAVKLVPSELTSLQIAAIAGAFTGKKLSSAKADLADNSNEQFDFTVRFTGNAAKAAATKDRTTERDAHASDTIGQVSTRSVFCELLRQLGIGPDRLRTAFGRIKTLPTDANGNAHLAQVFADIAAERAKGLTIKETTKGSEGSVKVTAVAQLIG